MGPGIEDNRLLIRLPAVAESVTKARHAVTECTPPTCDRFAVQTVVSELVGNAVVHAYAGRPVGEIVIVVHLLDGVEVVVVADNGVGMGPRLDSPGLGLGLPLSGRLTRDLRIESNGHGTTISASFDLSESPDRSADEAASAELEWATHQAMLEAREAFAGSIASDGLAAATA